MKLFSARSRIVFGQVCLLISLLLGAICLGLVPDRDSAVMQGRARLCEAVALHGSVLASRRNSQPLLEAALTGIVGHNPDLLSAGVKRNDGTRWVDVGEHSQHWIDSDEDEVTNGQVEVPIFSRANIPWGVVQLRFKPLRTAGFSGMLTHPLTRLVVVMAAASFVVFFWHLRRMLQHLDPSRVVPARVRSALDTLNGGLLVMDNNERIVLANQAFANTVGKEPEALQGVHASKLPWMQSLDDDNDDGSLDGDAPPRNPWLDVIEDGVPRSGVMLGLLDRNSGRRAVMVNCSPVLAHDGKHRGVLVSLDDVTELEQSKVDLTKSKAAAESANRAKSEFLASMSHEIRTPMNAILGFTDVLRRGFDEDVKQRREYLDTIHSSGKYLLDLINDILDLSKVESGRLELDSAPCSPHELMHEVVSVLSVKAREKGITLQYESDGKIPATIQTDPLRLRQALVNLTGNALKFTDQGGVTIVARLLEDGPEPQLEIDVVDTGIGIAKDNQERIFEPFSQADGSVTRRFGGTGLGLAISRRFAEALGGKLTVTSAEGKGSTFTIRVNTGPLDGVRLTDSRTAAAEIEDSTKDSAHTISLPQGRILVVDDGDANRKLISLVLRRAGAKVEVAENGHIGVDLATRQDFDLILMDMQMPVMDGYTATRTLRAQGFTKPIFALTANAMQGDEEKCRDAGCSGFLTKPIDMDTLIQTIAEALGGAPGADVALAPPSRECLPGESLEPSKAAEPVRKAAQAEGPEPAAAAPHEIEFDIEPRPESTFEPCTELTFASAETTDGSSETTGHEAFDPDEAFATFLADQMIATHQAWAEKDLAALTLLAHDLKGTCGTFGQDQFTEAAVALERCVSEEQLDEIASVVAELMRLTNSYLGRQNSEAEEDVSLIAADEPAAQQHSSAAAGPPITSSLPMDDEEFVEIVEEFVQRLHEYLEQMRRAWEDRDLPEVARLAHWLKGSGGTAGFDAFTVPSRELEQLVKEEQTDQIEAYITELQTLAARIVVRPQLTTH